MSGRWEALIPGVCGFGLHFQLDGFRLIYSLIAVVMWAVSGAFSREYMAHYENRRRYYLFFWTTFFATAGVFLSADLYTTFIFFEIMSLTSYVWVAFDEKKESLRAAETYLAVAIIGGMVMLMGLFLLADCLGTLAISELSLAAKEALARGQQNRLYAAGLLLLFGFGAKAGAFPLHIWLPKAHPVAPAPASALLSGILTKTGIFGIIIVSLQLFTKDGLWGLFITLLGLVTMFLGAFLALFSVNLKRTLACSSVSQIGFILVGIGMAVLLSFAGENPAIAARGAFLHMLNHSLFKLVLFLCAGAVYMKLHQLDLNEIRGYGRNKPVLAFCFLMGAMGISGIPGWSGYVSKTLLHESIVEYQKLLAEGEVNALSLLAGPAGQGKAAQLSRLQTQAAQMLASPNFWKAAEWVFLITGGMTLAYMLKLFITIFIEENPKRQEEFDKIGPHCMLPLSKAVLLLPALLFPLMGFLPALTMDRLADQGQWFFLTSQAAAGSYSGITGTLLDHGLEHHVAYFSWENLKGGLRSIGIGICLYFIAVRQLFMTETGSSQQQPGRKKEKYHVNRWPAFLDLENLIYRPVLQVLLPGILGAVCSFMDRYIISVPMTVFLQISSLICRGMDHMADGIILLARKTTHRQAKEAKTVPFKYRLAEKLGGRALELIEWEAGWKTTGRLVQESFSFGLMLFCIGLCLTLGYLLYVFLW